MWEKGLESMEPGTRGPTSEDLLRFPLVSPGLTLVLALLQTWPNAWGAKSFSLRAIELGAPPRGWWGRAAVGLLLDH